MKKMNWWKSLLCVALGAVALTACKDDDTRDFTVPTINVNGVTELTLAHDLTQGVIEPSVTVEALADWSLAFNTPADEVWCVPSQKSGKKGTSTLSFTVSSSTVDRETVVTFTATSNYEGFPVQKYATLTIRQNAAGSTEVTTNVKTTREQLSFATDAAEITKSMTITGVCVSDVAGNNINNKQIMIADKSDEPGAGLMIRFKAAPGITRGQIVSLDLNGGSTQIYSGTYQVDFSNATADPTITVKKDGDNTPDPIEVTDLTTLGSYQSQYVKIYSQPTEAIRGQLYYNVTSGYANQTFQNKAGVTFQLSFNSYSADWAKTLTIPAKAGYVMGCVSMNSATANLSPRNANDLKGLTDEIFEIPSTKATIAEIKEAGNYVVENALVVAAGSGTNGYVISDGTGVMFVYGNGNTTETQRVAGQKLTIDGTVSFRTGSVPQFANSGAKITVVSSDNAITHAPKTYTATEVDAFVKDVECVEVELTGKLNISGNYYNLAIEGTTVVGSIKYYTFSDAEKAFDDRNIIVKGYAIGTSTSGSTTYMNVLPYSIEATKEPFVTATETSLTFAAAGEEKTVAFEAGNLGTNQLFAKFTGDDAAQFSAGTVGESSVAVTAKANTGTAAQKATMTLYVAASKDAAESAWLASATVECNQKAATDKNITVAFEKAADFTDVSFPYQNANKFTGEKTIKIGDYNYTFNAVTASYGIDVTTAGAKYPVALFIGKKDSYIEFPAIEGYKLASVYVRFGENMAGGNILNIFDADGNEYSTKNAATVTADKGGNHTFQCTGTVANKAYRLKITSSTNFQTNGWTLTYEKVE